ncbi:MAG: hypothetical protein Tsb006_5390 [Rickettsiaceae bacterium]
MSTIINIVLLVVFGAMAIFMIKKLRQGHNKVVHLPPKDPRSQALYEQNKKKEDEKKELTLQEKIELSWAFLVNITEQVMNRFSKQDQQKVNKAGEALSKNGARYQHNIESESEITLHVVRSREKNKDQSLSR